MATQRRARPGIAIPALISHIVMTAVVWRDISRRDPTELPEASGEAIAAEFERYLRRGLS